MRVQTPALNWTPGARGRFRSKHLAGALGASRVAAASTGVVLAFALAAAADADTSSESTLKMLTRLMFRLVGRPRTRRRPTTRQIHDWMIFGFVPDARRENAKWTPI